MFVLPETCNAAILARSPLEKKVANFKWICINARIWHYIGKTIKIETDT